MVEEKKVCYFVGQDNIMKLRIKEEHGILKGLPPFKPFTQHPIHNLSRKYFSNDKTIYYNFKPTTERANIVFFDIIRGKPYIESLQNSHIHILNEQEREIDRLKKENNAMSKVLFNLKGIDTSREDEIEHAEHFQKLRRKFSNYWMEQGDFRSPLLDRYMPPSIDQMGGG